MVEKLLTTEQVSDILGLHPQTVRMWSKQGKMPAIKVGRDWKFRPSDIDAFLERLKAGAEE